MPAITYTSPYPGGWHDLPATTTPIDAAALQTVDDGVAAATAQANAALAAAGSGSAALVPQAVQTASFAAAVDKFWPIDTTSATTVVATLPTAPADGKQVELKVVAGPTANGQLTHPVTVNLGGSDVVNVAGGSTTFQIRELNQGITLQYKASTAIWYVVSDDLSLAQLQAMFAPLVSPALIGTPTAPTQAAGDNSTALATTAYVNDAQIAADLYLAANYR